MGFTRMDVIFNKNPQGFMHLSELNVLRGIIETE